MDHPVAAAYLIFSKDLHVKATFCMLLTVIYVQINLKRNTA
jgi:hypothetical protein